MRKADIALLEWVAISSLDAAVCSKPKMQDTRLVNISLA